MIDRVLRTSTVRAGSTTVSGSPTMVRESSTLVSGASLLVMEQRKGVAGERALVVPAPHATQGAAASAAPLSVLGPGAIRFSGDRELGGVFAAWLGFLLLGRRPY